MAIEFPLDSDYLAVGIQPASVGDVKAALVDAFTESRTRRPVFEEWMQLRERVGAIVTLREQWVDGSFTTRKRDPADIDVATFLDAVEVDALGADDQETLNALMGSKSTEGLPLCDSFALVVYPQGHPMHDAYLVMKETFETTFYGYDSRANVAKGFLEVGP